MPPISPLIEPTGKTITDVVQEDDPNYAGLQPAVTYKYTYDDGTVFYKRSFDPDYKPKAVGASV